MNRHHKLLALLLCLVMTATLSASNGTQIGTVGARSTAMGSAFRGLADDWSAVYHNPAGLTQLTGKWTIGLSTGLIAPRGSYEAIPYPAAMMPSSLIRLEEVDATDRNFVVPAMSVFYKANEKLVLGLGVYAPFGLGTEWNLMQVPAEFGNAAAVEAVGEEAENYSDHQVISIQPTVAYQVSEKLSVGLGLNIIWGKMDLNMAKLAFNPGLAGIQGTPLAALLTGYDTRIIARYELSGTGTTFGANAGIKFDVTDKLSFGASVRYAGDLALSGDMTTGYYMPYNQGMIDAVTGMIQAGQISQADGMALIGAFSGEGALLAMPPVKQDVDADLPLPYTVGFGIAYKASEKLTITADASLSNWSSWDTIAIEGETGETKLRQDWENTWELGFGFEYMATEALAIRGGFYTVDSPVPDETMSPTILDPNKRNVFTGGIGYKAGKINFGLTGEMVTFADKTIDEYSFDTTTGVAENYAGTYKFNALVVTLGAQIELN